MLPRRNDDSAPYRIGVIGAGRIAKLIIGAITSGDAGNCEVCAILARQTKDRPNLAVPVITDRHAFVASEPDLVIEAAGPGGLRDHGLAALEVADIWSISGMALGDEEFAREIEATGKRTGHRLRLVGGAVGGLDAAAVAACDPNAKISIRAANEATGSDDTPDFAGTARDAIKSRSGVNFVAAVALAGPGLDNTHFTFFNRDPEHRRLFDIHIVSDIANYTMTSSPNVTPETGVTRTVAASVIAALIQAQQTIWAG